MKKLYLESGRRQVVPVPDKFYDSSINPGGNAKTSGGPGPRVRGSVGGESRVRGSVEGEVKTCKQTENAMA